jgi:hypothetical protein
MKKGSTQEVKAMKTLIEQETYIRLTDDMSGFVCTVTYGGYAKATEFILAGNPASDVLDEKALVLARKRSPPLARPEKQ